MTRPYESHLSRFRRLQLRVLDGRLHGGPPFGVPSQHSGTGGGVGRRVGIVSTADAAGIDGFWPPSLPQPQRFANVN